MSLSATTPTYHGPISASPEPPSLTSFFSPLTTKSFIFSVDHRRYPHVLSADVPPFPRLSQPPKNTHPAMPGPHQSARVDPRGLFVTDRVAGTGRVRARAGQGSCRGRSRVVGWGRDHAARTASVDLCRWGWSGSGKSRCSWRRGVKVSLMMVLDENWNSQ